MTSREKVLAAVKNNQPELLPLPELDTLQPATYPDKTSQFITVLQNIGGSVVNINSLQDISDYVAQHFKPGHHLVTTLTAINGLSVVNSQDDPHALETVEFALLGGAFAVAENGAIWLAESQLPVRVLPFICQHLAIVLNRADIVNNMHEAYERIGAAEYGFGVFIAGPSKTADIEQSLVLGAHGAVSFTVFML